MSCNRSLAITNNFHFAHSRLVSFLYRSRIVPSPYSHRVSYIIVVCMYCFLVYYHILSVVRLHTPLVCSHHRQTYRVVFVAIGLHPIRLSSACAHSRFPYLRFSYVPLSSHTGSFLPVSSCQCLLCVPVFYRPFADRVTHRHSPHARRHIQPHTLLCTFQFLFRISFICRCAASC